LDEGDFEIFVHDRQGKLAKKITREYDPVVLTDIAKEKLVVELFEDEAVRDVWDFLFPANYPPFSRFICDDAGRIFVKTYDRDSINGSHLILSINPNANSSNNPYKVLFSCDYRSYQGILSIVNSWLHF
jgi:hypothetical protein